MSNVGQPLLFITITVKMIVIIIIIFKTITITTNITNILSSSVLCSVQQIREKKNSSERPWFTNTWRKEHRLKRIHRGLGLGKLALASLITI